jgi:hypothetical protein
VPEQLQKWRKEEAIRKAEVAFLTDHKQRTLEFWWDQYCRDLCSLSDLRRRARRGRWIVRREEFWESVQQEILLKTKNRIVKDSVRELLEMQEVRQNLLELVSPTIVGGRKVFRIQPSSYEGTVRALVSVDELVSAKRTAVLQTIEPDIKHEMAGSSSVFTTEEIRKVSRMLLEGRRARQQQRFLEQHGERDGEQHGSDESDGKGEGGGQGSDQGPGEVES